MLFLGGENWAGAPAQARGPPADRWGVGVWKFLGKGLPDRTQRRARRQGEGQVASRTWSAPSALVCRLPVGGLPCRCVHRIDDPVLAAGIPLQINDLRDVLKIL